VIACASTGCSNWACMIRPTGVCSRSCATFGVAPDRRAAAGCAQ
jgi:hypothetical protein